jgi:hypothetical protein
MNAFRLITTAVIASAFALPLMPTYTASAMVPLPPPHSRPTPPPGWTYRWVPPTYSTVTRRVWIEGTTEWVCDWVWRYDRYEPVWRRVTSPGHWEERTERVEVRPGRWELVRVEPTPYPGPYPGPYPLPRPIPTPRPWQGTPTVGVDGYSSGPTEDLGKFTPLREWPNR